MDLVKGKQTETMVRVRMQWTHMLVAMAVEHLQGGASRLLVFACVTKHLLILFIYVCLVDHSFHCKFAFNYGVQAYPAGNVIWKNETQKKE